MGQQNSNYCFWEGSSWFWESGRTCLSVMIKVFNKERWSPCNKYFLDFSSLDPSQRLQPFMNCFSVVLSTGYKPSGNYFPLWVPHGPQVLLVNQLLPGLLYSGSSFLQGMPTWSSMEFPMGCSGNTCSTLNSSWTKKKSALHWDLLNLIWFSRAQFSSLSVLTALLNFMPSTQLLMMSPGHLPLPPRAMHFFLTAQFERRFLLSPASLQPALLDFLHTTIESSYTLIKVALSICHLWPAPLS